MPSGTAASLDKVSRAGRSLRLCAGVLVGALLAWSVGAETVQEVQAAYLYKFIGYIEWPAVVAGGTGPTTLCVAGSERVLKDLSGMVSSHPAPGRPVEVHAVGTPEEALECQMVFVGQDAWKSLPDWVERLAGHPVALVTDAPRGAAVGALLTFVQMGDRIRFEASMAAAQRADLRLSSRLLAIASRVWEERR